MFSLFRKKPAAVPLPVTLEQQLEVLAGCGIVLGPEATLEDILSHHTRQEYEAVPYKELIPVLGFEIERDAYAPLCERLWMCDYERVEDHGAYTDIVWRLHRMSAQCLPISALADFVDIEAEKAWVEFDLAGSRVHWDVQVDNDWMDPDVVVKFDHLLKTRGTPYRIYSNHTDFGQSAFFACMQPAQFEVFRKLATFQMREIDKQARGA